MKLFVSILLTFNIFSLLSVNYDEILSLSNPPKDLATLYVNSLDMDGIKNLYQTSKSYKKFINGLNARNILSPYLSWAILPIRRNDLNRSSKIMAVSSNKDFAIIQELSKLYKFDLKANKYLWEIDISDHTDINDKVELDYTNNFVLVKKGFSLSMYNANTGELIDSITLPYYINGIHINKDNILAIYGYGILEIYKIKNSNLKLINSIVLNTPESRTNFRDTIVDILDLNKQYIIIRTILSVEKLFITTKDQKRSDYPNSGTIGAIKIKMSPDHSKLIIVKEDNTFDKYIAEIWDVATNKLDQIIPDLEKTNLVDINLNYDNSLTIISYSNKIMVWDNSKNILVKEKKLEHISEMISGNKSNFIIVLSSSENPFPQNDYIYLNFIDLSRHNLLNDNFISRTLKLPIESYKSEIKLSKDDSILYVEKCLWQYNLPESEDIKNHNSKKRSSESITHEDDPDFEKRPKKQ